GWEWHPFSAERQLVASSIAAGRLKRLGGETLVSSSPGA
ncbi:Urease operon accessory protein, partial [Rhizobium ruizarguesonis]